MSDEKTAGESADVELVEQEHGGALLSGGKPGNRGGGRTPSALRRAALEKMDGKLQVLEDIALNKDSRDVDKIAAVRELRSIALSNSMPMSEARAKLDATLAVIESKCGHQLATELTLEIRRIWVGH